MAATTKGDLMAVCEKDYARLRTLIDGIPEEMATRRFDEGVTIKDTVGHRAHWIGLFFTWLDEIAEHGKADMPAKGYKWSELKPYNAKVRDAQAGMRWDEVREMLADRHARLMAHLNARSQDDLYGAPLPGGSGARWTEGRYAEASGASHYRSAAKVIRACLRQAQSAQARPPETARTHPD